MPDSKDMKEIKKPQTINDPYLDELQGIYKGRRKGMGKRSEDIPLDDVLIDDTLDFGTPAKTEKPAPQQPAEIISEETEEKFVPVEEETAVTEEIPEEEPAEEEAPTESIPEEDEPVQKNTKKGKKLRKNLGLDDNLTVVDGANATTEKSRRKHNHYVDPEVQGKRIRVAIAAILVAAAAYACVFGAVNLMNKDYYEETSKRLSMASVEEKVVEAEERYYIDSDMDGLADDFEENALKTDPTKADSDSDGIPDGSEYICGADPLDPSDGGREDFERIITTDSAVLIVKGGAKAVSSASVETADPGTGNYPGVIGNVYRISGTDGSASLTIGVGGEEVGNIGIFRLENENSTAEEITSAINGGAVSADNISDGLYFAADRALFSTDAGTDVMFVIDNSGSMYPKELVSGSEENDVEFKRIDLSENLLKVFGENTSCGVAKFTAQYTLVSPLSPDKSLAEDGLESIRSGSESFSGTDFAGAVLKAAEAFTDESRRRFIVLITDGLPSDDSFKDNEDKAVYICKKNNISVISISLGNDTDIGYLTEIAEETGGVFYRAFNADSLEETEKKITNFINKENDVVSDENGENISVTAVADSGFGSENCVGIAGIPTTLSVSGSLTGSAVVNKLYYTGDLPLAGAGYYVSSDEFLKSGKEKLSTYSIPCLAVYSEYLNLESKWDFTSEGSVLRYGEETKSWLSAHGMTCSETEFSGSIDQSDTMLMLRKITFQQLRDYSIYEKAVIDVDALPEEEQQIFRIAASYDNMDRYKVLSFGSDGKAAYDLLCGELGSGIPSVLVTDDGRVFNASSLSKNTQKADSYVIKAFESGKNGSEQNIFIEKQKVYTGSGVDVQFVAKCGGQEIRLYILK